MALVTAMDTPRSFKRSSASIEERCEKELCVSTPREGRRRSIRAGETGSLADTSGGMRSAPLVALAFSTFFTPLEHPDRKKEPAVCDLVEKPRSACAHAYPGQTRTRSKLLSQRRCARHAATAKTRGEGSGRDAQTYESHTENTPLINPTAKSRRAQFLVCESDPGRSRGETTCAPTTPQSRQARPMNLMLQEYMFSLQQSSP